MDQNFEVACLELLPQLTDLSEIAAVSLPGADQVLITAERAKPSAPSVDGIPYSA